MPTVALISVGGPSATIAPVGHQHRAIGVRVGLLEVVGGEQDRLAARGELAHRRPERAAALDVHRHRRLVEHEQLGVADQREREAHALGLAAGELLRAPLRDVARAPPARSPRRRRAAPGTARPPSPSARAPTGRGSARRSAASRRRARVDRTAAASAPNTDTLPPSGAAGRAACRSSSTCRRRWARAARPSRRARSTTSIPRTACTVPPGPRKFFSSARSSIVASFATVCGGAAMVACTRGTIAGRLAGGPRSAAAPAGRLAGRRPARRHKGASPADAPRAGRGCGGLSPPEGVKTTTPRAGRRPLDGGVEGYHPQRG